jgi:hypothetical protein
MVLFNPVLDTTEKGYGMTKVGENHKTDVSPNHHVKVDIDRAPEVSIYMGFWRLVRVSSIQVDTKPGRNSDPAVSGK